MSYGIIRVRNLSASDLRNTEIHNARQYDQEGINPPDNIAPGKKGKYGINNHVNVIAMQESDKSIKQIIKERFDHLGITPRKNSVHAIEYVLALSPDCKEAYQSKYDADGMLSNLSNFVTRKHGKDNVVSISTHFDETNPHVHMIVTPIVEKEKRWKNRHGEGKKKVHALSARDFTGGPDKLRQLQQEFFEFVRPYGNKLGKEFYRGTLAEKQKKKYVRQTDHQIGQLRAKLASLTNDHDKSKVLDQINELKSNFDANIEKLDNTIEKHERANKTGKWKKEDFFHDQKGSAKKPPDLSR